MTARWLGVLFAFTALIAVFRLGPPATVFAQQGKQAKGGFGRGATPTFPGPPAGTRDILRSALKTLA